MTPLFHITHLRNLDSMLAAGCIWCDQLRISKAPGAVSIAYEHIKDRRSKRRVCCQDGTPIAAGGFLCDYVPFYFAPRSPMLFTIHCGNVPTYQEGQRPILHLGTTAEALQTLGYPLAFTDGHAEIGFSEFYDDLDRLEQVVDWKIMADKYWRDTTEDPDRKRRRQAEFLVHQHVPWESIEQIGVINRVIKRDVEAILIKARHKPDIVIKGEWYY